MNQSTTKTLRNARLAAGIGALAMAALVAWPWHSAVAEHQPADKLAVTGSALEVMTAAVTDGFQSEEVTLASASMRTSSSTDLVFSVTAECALWTDVMTSGTDSQSAFAQVEVWVEFNGQPVPVAGDDTGDNAGRVVFCDRTYTRSTMFPDDDEHIIETFMATRTANAFNWALLDAGNGIHTVEVKAQLTRQASSTATAQAAVGKRTLLVEPVKLSSHAEL